MGRSREVVGGDMEQSGIALLRVGQQWLVPRSVGPRLDANHQLQEHR